MPFGKGTPRGVRPEAEGYLLHSDEQGARHRQTGETAEQVPAGSDRTDAGGQSEVSRPAKADLGPRRAVSPCHSADATRTEGGKGQRTADRRQRTADRRQRRARPPAGADGDTGAPAVGAEGTADRADLFRGTDASEGEDHCWEAGAGAAREDGAGAAAARDHSIRRRQAGLPALQEDPEAVHARHDLGDKQDV